MSLPSWRRLLIPAILFLIFTIWFKSSAYRELVTHDTEFLTGTTVNLNISQPNQASNRIPPILRSDLDVLFICPAKANQFTNAVRLSSSVYNISRISLGQRTDERQFWNPTIISLPYWSKNQYLIVSRILTDGFHQQNAICEANICHDDCSEDDRYFIGAAGGMRCAFPPVQLNIPPTPAERCEGKFGAYVDIPGFHDPRIFWSSKGEPLMMVNTQYVSL
jgi:hypothetical protein